MSRISTYPILSTPSINDMLIGTDVENLKDTKNFLIGDLIQLIGGYYVPYMGAQGNVDLGQYGLIAGSVAIDGGSASQFVKADGSLDSTLYTPQSRTLTINGVTYDLSQNRTWNIPIIDLLTTVGTGGAATLIGSTLNIPQYQPQGNYITGLTGEVSASGPGNASAVISNNAVISKVLNGLNITGGSISSTDTIIAAFGKIQNQLNGLVGGVQYQGLWNAATNTPNLQSSVGTKGYYYVVSVAGSTNLNGITDWKLGDWAIYDGTVWQKVDNTDAVVSVNGYTGAVELTYADVGAVPTGRTLTINGVTSDLSSNRAWIVGDVRTDGSYANPAWITSLSWSKIASTPTTLAGYGITDAVPAGRTLTINGTAYDLAANRSWSVGTLTSISTIAPLTGGTITDSGSIGITQAGAAMDGYLSSADWNMFNNKQDVMSASSPLSVVGNNISISQSSASTDGYLSSLDWNTFNNKQDALTNPVTGIGTTYYIPMWTSSSEIGNSIINYALGVFNFEFNTTSGAVVNFLNSGTTLYGYSISMANVIRATYHMYTDGIVVTQIGAAQVHRIFQNGNTVVGSSDLDGGQKLQVGGDIYVQTVANAATNPDKWLVSDSGVIKYRTTAQLLVDMNAVPYTGASANVNLGEYGIAAGYFGLDLTPTNTPSTAGTMFWSADDKTLDVIMDAGVTQKVGQETFYLVKNQSGAPIPKGTIVMAAGTLGASGRILVTPFLANGAYPSKFCMGVTAETIADGADGFVVAFGKIRQINTASYSEGTILYASPTSAGGFTATAPQAPNNIVTVAIVVTSHTNNGVLFIRTTYGANINEDEGVKITSPVANQGLFYNGGYWVNKTIAQALGYVPANEARQLTINGQAYDLSADRVWSVGTVTSVDMSVPIGFEVTGNPVTSAGTLSVSFAAGYSLPTDAKQAEWDTAYSNRIVSLTTQGTGGAATLISNILNIPQYQAQGDYITSLIGEATADGPGVTSITLSNSAVISKVLTGLSVAGGSILSTDTILTAFGKLQNQINGIASGMQYQGTWNASTNTPNITSGVGTDGYYYVVSVAGTTNIDGITDWQVGDWIVFHGTAWQKIDNTDSVTSVNGFVGAVSLSTTDVPEGTELYFTQLRARQSISLTTLGASGAASYDNVLGVLNIPQYTLAGLGGVPTGRTLTINGTPYDLSADRAWSVGTVTSISTTGPITGGVITESGTIGITQAGSASDGYLSAAHWNIFNNKQNAISLTTLGSSGASTFVGAVLNIPNYTLAGLGGVPTGRTITINGVGYDLSADRSWSVGTVTGSGNAGYVSRWGGSTALADSLLFDSGSAIGLGTASIDASALFQMNSTSKGFLVPRMTAAQRAAISAPAQGLIVYQTDGTIGLYIYSNSVWRSLTMV